MQPTPSPQDPTSSDATAARYKYQRLRDRLREAIKTSELTGKLPGERALARRYQANAKTINKALCDLTTEGLLIRHVGRGTFVAGSGGSPVTSRRKLQTYAWLACGTEQQLRESPLFRAADALLRHRGHRLTAFTTDAVQSGEITETAVTPSHLRSWDGLILADRTSDRLLAELHRRHLPVVFVQNSHARIRISCVLPDYAQGAFELTQMLIHLGHREVRLAIAPELLPASMAAESGYRSALQRNGIQAGEPILATPDINQSPFWRTGRPSALVCVGSDAMVRISTAAREAGWTLPGTLSLCSILEPGRQADSADCTSYEIPVQTMAEWVVELLLSAAPGQSPRVVIVPGRLRQGNTTAVSPAGASNQGPDAPALAVI